MSAITAFCPECGQRQIVEETSTEGHMERYGEVEYPVTRLACGHSLQGPETVIGAAPGAPWAPGAAPSVRRRHEGTPVIPWPADPFEEG